MKRCRHCDIEKPASEFRRNPRCRDELSSWCADCHNGASRRWREANPGKVAAYNEARRVVANFVWTPDGYVPNPSPRPKSKVR